MPTQNPHVSIIVCRGDPLDYQRYRHALIWIQFEDGSTAIRVHVVGPVGEFKFEAVETTDATKSVKFAKRIDVGYLNGSLTSKQTIELLEKVQIHNTDREFNCQTWVESALKLLKSSKYLSGEAYENGVDRMVDAIAEAQDVEA